MTPEDHAEVPLEHPEEYPGGPERRGLRVLLAVLLATVVVVAGGFTLARWVQERLPGFGSDTPRVEVEPGLPVEVQIPRGATAREIGDLLAARGVIRSAVEFEAAVRLADAAGRLQAGRYDLETGMSTDQVIEELLAGPIVPTYWVTIREGLRIEEILAALEEQTPFGRDELEAALLSGAVVSALLEAEGAPKLQDWEGLLFPDTYQFAEGAAATDVLSRLARTMEQRVEAIDWSEFEEAGLSRYEGVIVASLIEAETRVDEDRPLVSSVIRNRLEQGMQLQIDATVLYALGERGIALTFADLEIDSPYNTYFIAGLPPTPIAAPGRASLEAAASPAATDYLYYVLTSTDGSHSFTASYDEFLRFKEQAKADGVIP